MTKDEIDAFMEEGEEQQASSQAHEGHNRLDKIKKKLQDEDSDLEEQASKKHHKKLDEDIEDEVEKEFSIPTRKEAISEDEAPADAAGKVEDKERPPAMASKIYALRTTANREDQVMSFIASNVVRKKIPVYTVIRPHGMRGYIFIEAESAQDAEQGAFGVPYARGILSKEIDYKEIEHMLERVKKDVNILKNDIVEIISGPFKREKAKITRVDKQKEEVVVELLEAAVPIPVTVRMDAVKVVRRDTQDEK
jgi:transcription termination/antitermination protein NusG